MAEYEVDADPGRIDMDVVWSYLHDEAYWGRGRTRANVEAQARGAWRVVGAYADDGSQVGFARAVSDGVAFAYLADVFVLKDHRGKGLGRRIVHTMIEEGPGAEYRWLLHTGDATFLYASFGFRPTDRTVLERPAGPASVIEP
jgi:predicted N-acetyltransferase YhbS